ncbi:MAG: Type 1 glutamine amidotransferase-like domain-containing protein, partial [Eubacterium sp.]|nr:Type 1 glutamine amidotransferase-like domain-containing protein [Eubacterium sp.]
SFIENQDRDSYIAKPLIDSNGFVDNLKKYWKDDSKILIFASNPEDFPENDFKKERIMDGFSLAGFSVENVNIYDHRNNEDIKKMIHWADVIYLSGGHCPTENKFIKETGLKEALKEFNGIFIGLSAGSVNAAGSVFLIPEEKGEAIDKDFIYFTEGLGLTDINIIPHSEYLKEVILDGKHMMNDIFIPFSYERKLYLLPDGSYFMIKDGETQLFGEAEVLFDGKIYPIKTGMVHTFDRMIKAGEWKVISNAGYDAVFKVDIENDKIDFIHYSKFFEEKCFDDLRVKTYRGFLDAVSEMIVDEERKAMDDGTALDIVLRDIEKNGIFVATFHVDTEEGTRAENVRIFRTREKNVLMCIIVDIAFILDHDWMTDIYSRVGFIRILKKILPMLAETGKYSLCFTNILNFKAINNLFGEKKGDLIIFQERDVLINDLKPLIIGHLDADHYALVVENKYLEKDYLKNVCRQIYKEKYKQYTFYIRLGVYPIEQKDVSVTHMLDCAKLAENKINTALNENIRIYDDEMRIEYDNRHILTQDLSEGIKNKE